jgi:GDPmannose 4,6-dehydratase
MALGMQDKLYMGNIDAKRDWGHAKDYVEAMWRILQQDRPEDFVIATGVTTTVRDFIRMAFEILGAELEFKGEGVDEKAYVKSCTTEYFKPAQEVMAIDPAYFRPTEVELLIGDPTKAKEKLGWTPKYDLAMLVKEMVLTDLEVFRREKTLKDAGFNVLPQYE